MFVILYLHRHPLKGVRTMAHPFTAETLEEAEKLVMHVATELKAPAYHVEFEAPEIRPQLSLVKD